MTAFVVIEPRRRWRAESATRRLALRGLAVVLGLMVWLGGPTAPRAAEIWLVDRAPVVFRNGQPSGPPNGAMELFDPQAPWSRAAKAVSVLKVPTRFLVTGTDDNLSVMFRDLKRRHIAFALETGLLALPNCGRGVEGFAFPPTTAGLLARKVRDHGGELAYVAMDEPLEFGHLYSGPNACKAPIDVVAREVAARVRDMRQVFPKLQVGDIEPVGSAHPEEAVEEIMQWATAYQAALGEPLAFLHADVQWGLPWREELQLLAARLRAAHIRFGVIYNGNGSDTTGVAWTQTAEQRFVAVEDDPARVPDQAILQSWMTQPTQMLPETEPGTLTYLVNRYTDLPSHITVQRVDGTVTGRLTGAAGEPLAGQKVALRAVANALTAIENTRTLTNTVPAGAARAVLAIRINTECGGCSGPVDVVLGPVRYRDDRSGETVERRFRQPDGTTPARSHLVAAAGQEMWQNTPPFPVVPGDPYTMDLSLTAAHDSDHGYVAVIFLDQAGRGMSRRIISFAPTSRPAGTAMTDAAGRFAIPLDAELGAAHASYRATFGGNAEYRLSSRLAP